MFPDSAATIAGVYREIAPPPDLAAHVACVWTSVVARRRDPPGRLRRTSCGAATGLVVAGPATGPRRRDVPVGAPVFGVRFRLGAAGAALGLPAEELADARVPVAEVWGAGVDERVAARRARRRC